MNGNGKIEERLEALEKAIVENTKAINALRRDFSSFISEQRKTNSQLTNLLKGVSARIGAVEGRMSAVEERVCAVEEAVNTGG